MAQEGAALQVSFLCISVFLFNAGTTMNVWHWGSLLLPGLLLVLEVIGLSGRSLGEQAVKSKEEQEALQFLENFFDVNLEKKVIDHHKVIEAPRNIVNFGREHKVYYTDEELIKGRLDSVEEKDQSRAVVLRQEQDALNRGDYILTKQGLFTQGDVERPLKESVQELVRRVEEATEEISLKIAETNKLGYTIAGGFFWGAFFDTMSAIIKAERTFWELLAEESFIGTLLVNWGYGFGYSGPWIFTSTFGPGNPYLTCTTQNLFKVLARSGLVFDSTSLRERPRGELAVLRAQLRRDFNLNLDCVVSRRKRWEYEEAEAVTSEFEKLLELLHLHKELQDPEQGVAAAASLATLDTALELLWSQLPELVQEAVARSRRSLAIKNAVYILVGLVNLVGWVGGNIEILFEVDYNRLYYLLSSQIFTQNIMEDLQDFLQNGRLDDGAMLGSISALLGVNGWGYGYTATFLLFVDSLKVECDTKPCRTQLRNIMATYPELASPSTMVMSLGRPQARFQVGMLGE